VHENVIKKLKFENLLLRLQGQENERFFAMQAELEKQFSVLAAQLAGPVSEFEESERESQVYRLANRHGMFVSGATNANKFAFWGHCHHFSLMFSTLSVILTVLP